MEELRNMDDELRRIYPMIKMKRDNGEGGLNNTEKKMDDELRRICPMIGMKRDNGDKED